MVDALEFVGRYLAPAAQDGWRWSDDCEALEFRDGRTIALRGRVEDVLRHVATTTRRVPPFRAVVLLLAALRRRPPRLDGLLEGLATDPRSPARAAAPELGAADAVLERVPEAFWLREDAAAVLCATVVEGAGGEPQPDIAALLLAGLDCGGAAAEPFAASALECERGWLGAVALLRNGLPRLPAEAMLELATTGTIGPPAAAAFELPVAARVRSVLDTLVSDPEDAALARVVRDAMAAIRLPRVPLSTLEQAGCEVADLSNRGPLDRLLSSELANDDLTLALRIARNEALYLRREPPATVAAGVRFVFVDSGLRSWGVARLFAVAIALALAATTPRGGELVVCCDAGGRLLRLDLASAVDLRRLLSSLATTSVPSAVLSGFLREVDAFARGGREVVVVTHPGCVADRDFAGSLAELASREAFVVTVDRDGRFELIACAARGRSRLAGGRLDAAALSSAAARKPVPLRASRELPFAIDAVTPFPLRLPVPKLRASARRGGSVVGLAPDGRIVCWDDPSRGARQLVAATPGGSLLCFEQHRHEQVDAVFGPSSGRGLVWLRVDTASAAVTRREVDTGSAMPQEVVVLDEVLCLVMSRSVVVVEPDGSHSVLELPSGLVHWRGRFFRSATQAFALSRAARGARLVPLPSEPPIGEERSGVRSTGRERVPRAGRGGNTRFHFRRIARSPDGGRLMLEARNGWWHELRVESGGVRLASPSGACAPQSVRSFDFVREGAPFRSLRWWRARWDSGCDAAVDSRGLLHLRRGGGAPELAMVLSDAYAGAVWCSDGIRHGPGWYFDDDPPPAEPAVETRLSRFLEAMR